MGPLQKLTGITQHRAGHKASPWQVAPGIVTVITVIVFFALLFTSTLDVTVLDEDSELLGGSLLGDARSVLPAGPAITMLSW